MSVLVQIICKLSNAQKCGGGFLDLRAESDIFPSEILLDRKIVMRSHTSRTLSCASLHWISAGAIICTVWHNTGTKVLSWSSFNLLLMIWGFPDIYHHFYFSDWYLSCPSATTVFFVTSCASCTIFHGAHCITWCLLLIWACVWGRLCCGRKEEWWERICELCHRLLRASSHIAKTCVASTSPTSWVTLVTPALRSLTVSIFPLTVPSAHNWIL